MTRMEEPYHFFLLLLIVDRITAKVRQLVQLHRFSLQILFIWCAGKESFTSVRSDANRTINSHAVPNEISPPDTHLTPINAVDCHRSLLDFINNKTTLQFTKETGTARLKSHLRRWLGSQVSARWSKCCAQQNGTHTQSSTDSKRVAYLTP